MLRETETYIGLLRDRRADILKTLEGLGAEGLNWHPLLEETNSPYALALHSLGAERRWIHEIVGGRKIERDRAAELRAHADDTLILRAAYETAARESEEILRGVAAADLDSTRSPTPSREHSVRWCILHVIEHYSEHLGQLQLTRQMWENRHARPHEI